MGERSSMHKSVVLTLIFFVLFLKQLNLVKKLCILYSLLLSSRLDPHIIHRTLELFSVDKVHTARNAMGDLNVITLTSLWP